MFAKRLKEGCGEFRQVQKVPHEKRERVKKGFECHKLKMSQTQSFEWRSERNLFGLFCSWCISRPCMFGGGAQEKRSAL